MRTSAVFPVAAFAGLLAACSGATPDAARKDSAPAIPVEVATATRGEMLARYTGTATLEAEADAETDEEKCDDAPAAPDDHASTVGRARVPRDGEACPSRASEDPQNRERRQWYAFLYHSKELTDDRDHCH